MIVSGKDIANTLYSEFRLRASKIKYVPKLVVVLVGDNPASKSYICMKEKACAKVGINSPLLRFPSSISERELLIEIEKLNHDSSVNGILVQLPLPKQIDATKIMEALDPKKDVDGFHPINIGKLLLGEEDGFVPCTPLGIQVLLEKSGIEVAGKHVVIVGRSNIVGKPLAALLMQKKKNANATVTVLHSRSDNLRQLTASADILVAALGHPHFIKADMVKQGGVVIDVGINRVDGRLVGDVDFECVASKCRAITPVPGGVGPMTVAMLLNNTLLSCER